MRDEWSDLESTASSFRAPLRGARRRAPQSFTEGERGALMPMMPFRVLDSEALAISATQSTSMLTCNKVFKERYPIVYQGGGGRAAHPQLLCAGLCKGLIDVRTLMAYEMVVPIKETVKLKRCLVRSAKHVTDALATQLRKAMSGKFPDPKVSTRLTQKIGAHIWAQLKNSIQEAEDDRTFLQWLLRFDVEAESDIRLSLNHADEENNSIVTHVEGSAQVLRRKGDFFSLVSVDTLAIHVDCVIKALFVNEGQLAAMNKDTQFVDFVRTGDNRFAKRLMY